MQKTLKMRDKDKSKKQNIDDFSERYIQGNIDDERDNETRPEKDPMRVLQTPDVVAALNNDEHIQSKTLDTNEKEANEGATFFGESFIRNNQLTGDDPGGASDNDRFEKYDNMVKTSKNTIRHMKASQKEKIQDILANADSEEQMHQAVDFEILDGDSKQEEVLKEFLRKVDRHAGDSQMEEAFDVSETARSIKNEIANLKFEQTAIKSRYIETYPEGERQIRTKLKAKAQLIHGQSLMERTGISIDREPDSGFW